MKKTTRLFALLLAALLCISACGGGGDATKPADNATKSADNATKAPDSGSKETEAPKPSGKTDMTMVSPFTDTGNYNVWLQNTSQASAIFNHVMEGLLVMETNGEYTCVLAESYNWVDSLTLDVTIREGVKFHNGDVLTVEDVIFSNELSIASPGTATGFRMVDSIEKIDDRTIRYHLGYSDADILNALTNRITCKKYYEEVGEAAFGTSVLGTGYFMWDDYVSGDHVTLKAFPDYWGEHGTLESLTIRFISENSQALIDLESGNLDLIPATGSTMASIQGNDKIKTLAYSSLLNEYIGFNFNSEKAKDIKVREAVSRAVNREDIIAAAREGYAIESYGMIPTYSDLCWTEEKDLYPYDPDAAAQILGELGYSKDKPLDLILLTDTSAARKMEAEQIKNQLDKVGFNITISTYESATVTSILAGGNASDYDIYIRAISVSAGAPVVAAAGILSLDGTATGNNPEWLTADSHELAQKYQDLIIEAKSATDPEERVAKYTELQQTEREMIMACWMLVSDSNYALNAKLEGYYVTGSTLHLERAYFTE